MYPRVERYLSRDKGEAVASSQINFHVLLVLLLVFDGGKSFERHSDRDEHPRDPGHGAVLRDVRIPGHQQRQGFFCVVERLGSEQHAGDVAQSSVVEYGIHVREGSVKETKHRGRLGTLPSRIESAEVLFCETTPFGNFVRTKGTCS